MFYIEPCYNPTYWVQDELKLEKLDLSFPIEFCPRVKSMDLPLIHPFEKAAVIGARSLVHEPPGKNLILLAKNATMSSSIFSGIVQLLRVWADKAQKQEQFMMAVDLERLSSSSGNYINMCNSFDTMVDHLADRLEGGLPILVIDEIHLLMKPDYTGVFERLMVDVRSGRYRCIGATSPEMYSKLREFDDFFKQNFFYIDAAHFAPSWLQRFCNWIVKRMPCGGARE